MGEQENMLLKVGSLFILIGGIVSGLFGIIASAATMLAMNSLDEGAMSGLDSGRVGIASQACGEAQAALDFLSQ